jgi:hypothetical protein
MKNLLVISSAFALLTFPLATFAQDAARKHDAHVQHDARPQRGHRVQHDNRLQHGRPAQHDNRLQHHAQQRGQH